jgi:beta-phosphoglucomutase
MPDYEAIFFDFDGVLIDSEPLHFACWRDVLAPFGIQLSWERFRDEAIGITDRALVEKLASQASPRIEFEQLWERYPLKKRLFRSRVLENPPMAEGLPELLSLLGNYRLAVVSSSWREEVLPVLEHCGIAAAFGAVVCGDDVTRHKPAPEPYLKAAAVLGVSSALVLEDSETGAAAGRSAGFAVLRIGSVREMPRLLVKTLDLVI